MSRKIASLDIGSNSTLCLIVEEASPGVLSVVTDQAIVTGLGRGLSSQGLHPDARARTLEALRAYRTLMDAHQVREIHAAATAAMRDACDGERFAREIRETFHIPLEIISGEREAELTYRSVAAGFPRPHPVAVIDVGGRSSEIMVGQGARLGSRVSLPIGSVSGTEGFLEGDPVSAESVQRFKEHVRRLLATVPRPPGGIELFGVASTVTTFAAMAFQMTTYNAALIHGTVLTRDVLQHLLSSLMALPVAERTRLAGLDPRRADVIVAGGIIVVECIDFCGVDRLTVSDHGLRHGLLHEAFPDAVIRDPRL